MTTQEAKRKLAAILSADVKGYSRLMGENEVQTLKTLSAYFEVMTTLIQKHQGKVLNIAGDSVAPLVGFIDFRPLGNQKGGDEHGSRTEGKESHRHRRHTRDRTRNR